VAQGRVAVRICMSSLCSLGRWKYEQGVVAVGGPRSLCSAALASLLHQAQLRRGKIRCCVMVSGTYGSSSCVG